MLVAVVEVALKFLVNAAGDVSAGCGAVSFREVAVMVLCVVGVATDGISARAEPSIPAAAHD